MTRILPWRPLPTAFLSYRQRFWTAMYKSANGCLCAFIKAACRSTTDAVKEDDLWVIPSGCLTKAPTWKACTSASRANAPGARHPAKRLVLFRYALRVWSMMIWAVQNSPDALGRLGRRPRRDDEGPPLL